MAHAAVAAPLGALSANEKHAVVRRVLRVALGSTSNTPTPVVLRVADIGLLYFINQKQSQLHNALAMLDISSEPELEPLRAMVEFFSFVVGGLIVEAERVDEAVLTVQREAARVGAELRHVDVELQHQQRTAGTSVEQAIATHYHTRVGVPQRHAQPRIVELGTDENSRLGDLPTTMVSLRSQLQHLRSHLRVLKFVASLLHGNGARIPETEVAAIVAELDVLGTFRKANHKIRDAVFDVPRKEDLVAVSSLLEFIAYLDCGMTAALNDLQAAERNLKKATVLTRTKATIDHLTERDARNKAMSTEALRMNEHSTYTVLHRASAHNTPRPSINALPAQHQRHAPSNQQQRVQAPPAAGYTPPMLAGVTPSTGAPSHRPQLAATPSESRGLSAHRSTSVNPALDDFLAQHCA